MNRKKCHDGQVKKNLDISENTFILIILDQAKTATDMDGTLHTDLWKSETSRENEKSFEHHLKTFKSCIQSIQLFFSFSVSTVLGSG